MTLNKFGDKLMCKYGNDDDQPKKLLKTFSVSQQWMRIDIFIKCWPDDHKSINPLE